MICNFNVFLFEWITTIKNNKYFKFNSFKLSCFKLRESKKQSLKRDDD